MLLQKSKMNLLKLKVFFLSTLLQLCALTTTAQESPFDTMVNALISENVPVLSVEELQTKRNIILLILVQKQSMTSVILIKLFGWEKKIGI